MYQEVATVGYLWIRYCVEPEIPTENLAALYPAPDALTSISASFLKDYNPRVPFSKQARLPTRAEPSPFMPVTVELQTASLDLNSRLHSKTVIPPFGAQSSPLPSSSKAFTNIPLSPVTKTQNDQSARRFSRDGQHEPYAPRAKEPAIRPSASISMPGPSQKLTLPHSRETQPIVQAAESSSRLDSSPSTQLSHFPEDQNSSPITATQTVGVKRRLGMGRVTNGYSNKKFKAPM